MRRYLLAAAPLAGIATLLATAGPVSAAGHGRDHTVQLFQLTGAQEVPGPGDPDGRGLFASKVDLKRKTFCYALAVRNIGMPHAAHVHEAVRGVAGPINVTLKTPMHGFSSGCIKAVPDAQETPENAAVTLTFDELSDFVTEADEYYTNVHTEAFPKGAVRGQFR